MTTTVYLCSDITYPAVAANISNGFASVPQVRIAKNKIKNPVIVPSLWIGSSATNARIHNGAINMAVAATNIMKDARVSTCSSLPW